MGNEGQDNSQPPVNEVNKHPWEIFPEANSSDAKKSAPSEAELEKKRLKREKRDARRNSRNLWIKKHKILSLGIFLVLVALIVGAVFLVIFLTTPKETPAAVPDDDRYEKPASINIGDYGIDEIPSGELLEMSLDINTKADIIEGIYEDSILRCAKIIDNGNAVIKTKNPSKEHKIIYTLYLYNVAIEYDCVSETEDFIQDFDKQKITLNDKQKYFYDHIKCLLYVRLGDKGKSTEYCQSWEKNRLDNSYYYNEELKKFVKSNLDGDKAEN
jgi:hypothetical protein